MVLGAADGREAAARGAADASDRMRTLRRVRDEYRRREARIRLP